MLVNGMPIASTRLKPKMRSAAAFQKEIMPLSSEQTMASGVVEAIFIAARLTTSSCRRSRWSTTTFAKP